MTRYIVFERPQGGKTWTISFKESGVPAAFGSQSLAEEWVRDVHIYRRAWWGGKQEMRPMQSNIASVELPE